MRCLTRYQIETLIAILILAGCTVGCTTAGPIPPPEQPGPGVHKSNPGDSSTVVRASTSPFTAGHLNYDFRTFSVARALARDSAHRADSTLVAGMLTATLVAGPTANTILARVRSDSVSVTTGSGTSVPISSSEPFLFTINTRTGRVTQANQETTRDCTKDSSDSSPIYGREVLPSIGIPETQTWVDTVHTSMCRGGVLLTITRVASYTRLQSLDSAIQVLRSTQFHIAGSGHQWSQKIEVSGEGTSIDTLRLGGFPIRLREATGSSQVQFSFRTQLRTQEFLQTSMTRIELRN
jgi:hypothetical protein